MHIYSLVLFAGLWITITSSWQEVSADDKTVCNTTHVDKFLENPHLKSLDIETKKTRKWAKNYFKIIAHRGKNIVSKRKKKFKATIVATFTNGLICNFDAKIRVSGDWKDHVQNAPPLITSLDVKLLNGNINSVIKFKLLLAHTRNGDNEVFVTTLLRNIGFISPKTYYVPTLFNGTEYTYLFQEKTQKELIESYQLREGPVLEGDERLVWSDADNKDIDDRLSLARIINKNWANKGYTSLRISQESLTMLNRAYLGYLEMNYPDGTPNSKELNYGRFLNSDILANNNNYAKKHNQEYRALLVALRAGHGLRPHNRSFYYDPMYKYFLPIYYDGNSDILDDPTGGLFLIYGELNRDEITGAGYALASIQNIDRIKLFEQLKMAGANIDQKEINHVFEKIERNLKEISQASTTDSSVGSKVYFSKYTEPDKRIVFSGRGRFEIETCDFSLADCTVEILNINDYSRLLNGRYINHRDQIYIYVGVDKAAYMKGEIAAPPNNINRKEISIEGGARVVSYGSIDVKIDRETKELILKQQDHTDRIMVVGGKLSGWTIDFQGTTGNIATDAQRFNENLLTGCLTFVDIALENISIKANNAPCEDGVNFVRTSGNIKTINITNAQSDALDIDFSNLTIDHVNITNAGNDCIDFSAGSYKVLNSVLRNCKDKAVSVGEGSTTVFGKVDVESAYNGIAVKDSSTADVEFAHFKDVLICLSASRKKQEYWGSKLIIGEYHCPSGTNYQQEGSLIEAGQ